MERPPTGGLFICAPKSNEDVRVATAIGGKRKSMSFSDPEQAMGRRSMARRRDAHTRSFPVLSLDHYDSFS